MLNFPRPLMQLISLKELVAEELTRLPVDRLKLILGGKVLEDGALSLREGGKQFPAQTVQQRVC